MTRILLLTAIAALVTSLVGGCSSESSEDLPRGSIQVIVDPERRWYQTEQTVQLVGFVTDDYQNLIDDARVRWTVEPADGATIVDETQADPMFVLKHQGRVTFTACVTGGASNAPCDSATVQVDDGSPTLEILEPRAGGESDHAGGILVRGSVIDKGTSRVFVAGKLVEHDALGKFEVTVPAAFGINHLTFAASDGITPEAATEMDVLWAPRFAPAIVGGKPSLAMPDGVALSLGANLLDDGAALTSTTGNVVTQDVSDILHLVLAHADLDAMLPDPIDTAGLRLRIEHVTPGPVSTSLVVQPDGVDLFLRLSSVQVGTKGQFVLDPSTTLSLDGGIVATVAGTAHLTVRKEVDGDVQVDLTGLGLALESIEGSYADPTVSALLRVVGGPLRVAIESKLTGLVEEKLAEALPTLLLNLLTTLDTALSNKEIVLENKPFPVPVTLKLDGRLRSVLPRHGVDIDAVLGISLATTSDAIRPDSRGVAMSETAATPPFYRERPLQVGVQLAFINGLLHALWSSSMLELDLKDLAPSVEGLLEKGRISGKLPPLLRPARAGERGRFVLSLGQLEADLQLKDGERAVFGVGVDVEVDLAIKDNAITVVAPDKPRIRTWTILPSESALLNRELIEELLLEQWPSIRDAITRALKVQLPVPSLGDLGGIAPKLANMKLSLDLQQPPYLQGGYLMIEGALRGAVEIAP